MARYAELDPGFGNLSEEAQKNLREEASRFVRAEFPETFVVQVMYWQKDPAWVWFWQRQSSRTLRGIVQMATPRGAVAPVHFTPPTYDKAEMQFVFPRLSRGRPVVRADDSFLDLRIQIPANNGRFRESVHIRFYPKEMKVKGTLAY